MTVAKLTPQQFEAITKYRYGLDSRPINVPHITKTNYGYVLIRWNRFDAWNKWQDKGKPSPRPDNVWKVVPKWDGFTPWDLRKAILEKRPPTPPIDPHVPVPPLPPVPANAAQFQRVAYMADYPLEAMAWNGCKIAFSADPAYDAYATKVAADKAREGGHGVAVWFVPTEVSMARANEVAARLGTTVIIGQAETLRQFWASWNAGLRVVIGNIGSCLEDDQAALLIKTGKMIFVNEFYWNTRKGMTPNNFLQPVVSICIALYDGGPNGENKSDGWDPIMQDYVNAGYIWHGMSVYGPGTTNADWLLLNRYGI